MPKRFRDTGLWDKEWYVALSCVDRCALDYIMARCDAVGVWCPAFTVGERLIGEKVDWEGLPGRVNGNITILENGKWWLADFCKYQYGRIDPKSQSKVQATLYGLLVSHGLWDRYLATVAPTVQEKEKEKEKEEEKENYADDVRLARAEYAKLVERYGEKSTRAMIDKLSAAKGANGYKYKSDYKAILTWVAGAILNGRKSGGAVPAPTKTTKPKEPELMCSCGKAVHRMGVDGALCSEGCGARYDIREGRLVAI